MEYVKGYGLLAGYWLLTYVAGVSYWEIEPVSRPVWIAGALMVLFLSPRRRQAE